MTEHGVAPSAEVTPGAFTVVEVGDQRVLLARLDDGTVVAFGHTCPHQGHSLAMGEVEGGWIVCPHHRYAYDPMTGRNTFPGDERDVPLAVYPVVERDGWIYLSS